MASPSNVTDPLATRPSSFLSKPEMAFSVVLLPAPLAPSSATHWPGPTLSDTPFTARMTSEYSTSMLLTTSMRAHPPLPGHHFWSAGTGRASPP